MVTERKTKKRKKHRGIQERVGKDGIVTFRAQTRLHGKYVTESFSSLDGALAWLEKSRTLIREGKFGNEMQRRTFSDLVDRYTQTT